MDYDNWYYQKLDFDTQLDILDEYNVDDFEDMTIFQKQEAYERYKKGDE